MKLPRKAHSSGFSTARNSACASLVTPLLIIFSGKLE